MTDVLGEQQESIDPLQELSAFMPEWLAGSIGAVAEMSPAEYGWRLMIALLFGGGIALVYRFSHGRGNRDARSFYTTLILLCGLIAMVTVVIGGNVAKAFSLVGALSIVRFRTVVEDTRDTAFVIFSVIVGMAAGSGYLWLPTIGTVAVGGTAILLSSFQAMPTQSPTTMALSVRMGLSAQSQETLQTTLADCVESFRLYSAETAKQGAVIDFGYEVRLSSPDNISTLTLRLLQIESVQSVMVKEQ